MEHSEILPSLNCDDSSSGAATPQTGSDDHVCDQILIAWFIILRALNGVAVATKSANGETDYIIEAISAFKNAQDNFLPDQSVPISLQTALSLHEWNALVTAAPLEEHHRRRANIAIGLAFLCQSGRQNISVQTADLELVWRLVREALLDTSIPFTVSRSVGFLAVPLWSTVVDGNIQELFRFHVWLPDGKCGVADPAIHAHQCFGQSWTLAGEGRDHIYEFESTTDRSDATHAEYSISWTNSSGTESGTKYQTHQKSSTVMNTGKLVRVALKDSRLHSRNMEYSIPAGVCHSSDVVPNILHSTLFLFDASRGFCQEAPVLGPIDGNPFTQKRDPAGVTPTALVNSVVSVREWEVLYEQGLQHHQDAEWEKALQSYRAALHVCDSSSDFPQTAHYRDLVLSNIACATTSLTTKSHHGGYGC